MSPDVIVADEFAFIETEFTEKTILPMVYNREKTAAVFPSTVNDPGSLFDRMFDTRDEHGRPVIETITYSERVCRACGARGLAACEHARHMCPRWVVQERRERAALFTSDAATREMAGMEHVEHRPCFAPAALAALWNRPPLTPARPPRTFYVGIDPNSRGLKSKFAIVTLYIDAGTRSVVVRRTSASGSASGSGSGSGNAGISARLVQAQGGKERAVSCRDVHVSAYDRIDNGIELCQRFCAVRCVEATCGDRVHLVVVRAHLGKQCDKAAVSYRSPRLGLARVAQRLDGHEHVIARRWPQCRIPCKISQHIIAFAQQL